MSSKYMKAALSERVWALLARPEALGVSLLGLAAVEGLRALDPTSSGTMLVRFVSVLALVCGVVFLLESLRPTLAHVAATNGVLMRAWWFPFFKEEQRASSKAPRLGWWAVLVAGAAVVVGLPVSVLLTSVQTESVGEVVQLPGQTAEAFLTAAPEPGLRRSMGVQLELQEVRVDGATPTARIRATDLRSLAATDVALESANAVRVRGVVVALREVRPLGGLGAAEIRVGEGDTAEVVSLSRGAVVTLADGRELRWMDASANRLGTLGPALQLGIWKDGELQSRRWLYLESPELELLRADGETSLSLVSVSQPLAALFSVREAPSVAWGIFGIVLLAAFALGRLVARGAPPVLVGRSGDWVALEPAGALGSTRVLDLLREDVRTSDSEWVLPLDDEEV